MELSSIKDFLIIEKSVNGSVDVIAARYIPFLNYVKGKFYLKEHCYSTCTCLENVKLMVSTYIEYVHISVKGGYNLIFQLTQLNLLSFTEVFYKFLIYDLN